MASRASSRVGIEVPAGVAADLGQGGRVGQGDGSALRHRLDGGDAEALAGRGKHQRRRPGVGSTEAPAPGDSRAAGSAPGGRPVAIASRKAAVPGPRCRRRAGPGPARRWATSGSRAAARTSRARFLRGWKLATDRR